MIKYKLVCKNCKMLFDSWFSSSKEFEKLKKYKYLNCYNCNSLKVEKTLMSPNILNTKKKKVEVLENDKKKIRNKIKQYQKFIENNFEYVGKNFAHEARSIHYNNDKKSRSIYGNATTKEIEELNQEGINTEVVPWINKNEN
jgi:hypothetical protein